MEQTAHLLEKISYDLFNEVLRESWIFVGVKASITKTFREYNIFYKDGETIFYNCEYSRDVFERVSANILQIRETIAQENKEKGTWYSFRLEVNNEGKFEVEFDYDNKPNFTIELDDEDYIADFEQFPRDEQYIPDWLREILVRHGKL